MDITTFLFDNYQKYSIAVKKFNELLNSNISIRMIENEFDENMKTNLIKNSIKEISEAYFSLNYNTTKFCNYLVHVLTEIRFTEYEWHKEAIKDLLQLIIKPILDEYGTTIQKNNVNHLINII